MAEAPGKPPVVAESMHTHTPMNPHAQEHAEEPRRRWQNQPLPCVSQHVILSHTCGVHFDVLTLLFVPFATPPSCSD